MIIGCALYFPVAKPAFKSAIPQGRTDGGLFRSATWFEYEIGGVKIRLNLQHANLASHLQGFSNYVAQLPNAESDKAAARSLIARTKAAVGVVLSEPISPESSAFGSLVTLIRQFDGFMFVADSIMLADGNFLVGPMAEPEQDEEEEIRAVAPEECKHKGPVEGVAPERVARREHVYRLLAERGFRCARWLPLYRSEERQDVMRPTDEIAKRLIALNALYRWVAAPEEIAPTASLREFVIRCEINSHLTEKERSILSMPRPAANRDHAASIGWRLENMWALAWIVGFDPAPPFFRGQLPREISFRLTSEIPPGTDDDVEVFLNNIQSRPISEVAEQEDIFYCTHNAVRSAQTGESTVPKRFHPVADGGAIHERRHALTWALSPGTSWDDTDLST